MIQITKDPKTHLYLSPDKHAIHEEFKQLVEGMVKRLPF